MTSFLRTRISVRDSIIAVMALALGLQYAVPAIRALASDQPAGGRVVLGSAFTYQGRLEKDGLHQSGPVDLEFALYDVDSGGTPLATLPVLDNVAVSNGLFAVQLDFGAGQFAGDSRWLEVRSRDGASVGGFSTVGRQQLTATPYAIFATQAGNASTATTANAALAAPWSGLTGMPAGFQDGVDDTLTLPYTSSVNSPNPLFSLTNTNGGVSSVVLGYPLTGIASTSPGSAIVGESTSGLYGVYGKSLSEDFPTLAYGVRGDGETVGVFGFGSSGASAGVRGEGVSYGVHGKGFSYGIFGMATSATGTGVHGEGSLYGVEGEGNIGVRGLSTTAGGYGVRGESAGDGVYGQTATLGKAGVVGLAAGGAGTNYAGFFLGNVNVDGDLTANTVNGQSDARLKTDVVPIAYGLDAVLRIKPVSFSWIGRADSSTHLGFLAQDLQQVLPELVTAAADERGTLSVRYLELLPVIVRAIQEQEARLAVVENTCLPQ